MSKRSTVLFAIALLLAVNVDCSVFPTNRKLTWSLSLQIDAPPGEREAAFDQTTRVLESRLDALGLSKFEVKPLGDPKQGQLVVNLPDVPDRERLKALLTAGGRLELAHLVSPPSPSPPQTFATREAAIGSWQDHPNQRVLPYTEGDVSDPNSNSSQHKKWVIVDSPAIVDGRDLRDAKAVRLGSADDYEIAFSLKKDGAERFGAWTGANINEYLAVVLNDEVKSIASIKSQIFDRGMISGRFSEQHAEDLALILRSGALPAPVRILEERSIKT